jgi:hypothetical protein
VTVAVKAPLGKGFFDFPHLMSLDALDMESDEDSSSDEEMVDLPFDEEAQEEKRKSRRSFAKVRTALLQASTQLLRA